jgi:hypothetical protein
VRREVRAMQRKARKPYPQAKAKEKLQVLEIVGANRFERIRALLPNLRLRYPTKSEAHAIAVMARITVDAEDRAVFEQHIQSIILDAHLLDATSRNLSAKTVRGTLEDISKKALDLSELLTAMDVGCGGSEEQAGWLLEIKLADSFSEQELVLIPQFRSLLDALEIAASRAAADYVSKRGPKGAGGNPAFNRVIEMLHFAAWQRGGDWTNYRSADGQWTGTLLDALSILKPYLPSKLFPPGELGRSIDHIKTKLRKHITKKGRISV